MAKSPSHKFGQIIGDMLEAGLVPILQEFSDANGLYLDRKGLRPVRPGKKVSWVDEFDNSHDLDFVLEIDGSSSKQGKPIAFIEVAWRRYTKHSRNKAQEIQSAVLPLAVTHRFSAPKVCAVLAGVFTEGAIRQLRSRGFDLLYIPFQTIVDSFAQVGINADYDEDTPEAEFKRKIAACQKLTAEQRKRVADGFFVRLHSEVQAFLGEIRLVVQRRIDRVTVCALYGQAEECQSVASAIQFIEVSIPEQASGEFRKVEIVIGFTNGDFISANFSDRNSAKSFLQDYETPRFSPESTTQ